MSDLRLRDALERESHRVRLEPGAAERMFERRDRRDRRRRIATVAASLIPISIVVALVFAALSGGDADREVVPGPSSVAGTYVTRLPASDPDVARLGIAGRYELRLRADGSLVILSPVDVDMPGPPTSFTVTGDRFTTDLLVGRGCDRLGTYRWSLQDRVLTFTPADEPCDLRSVLLTTRAWRATEPPAAVDALQGEWTATFTCQQMVGTVEQTAASRHDQAFWRRSSADELGSPDPEDPCAANPPEITYTLRFAGDRLQIFDRGSAEGFDGRYRLDGDILTIRDPSTRNISGMYRLSVEIGPDSLTFRLLGRGATDPFFIATWQVAPFVRSG